MTLGTLWDSWEQSDGLRVRVFAFLHSALRVGCGQCEVTRRHGRLRSAGQADEGAEG